MPRPLWVFRGRVRHDGRVPRDVAVHQGVIRGEPSGPVLFELQPRALVEPRVAKDGFADGERGCEPGDNLGETLDRSWRMGSCVHWAHLDGMGRMSTRPKGTQEATWHGSFRGAGGSRPRTGRAAPSMPRIDASHRSGMSRDISDRWIASVGDVLPCLGSMQHIDPTRPSMSRIDGAHRSGMSRDVSDRWIASIADVPGPETPGILAYFTSGMGVVGVTAAAGAGSTASSAAVVAPPRARRAWPSR